VQTCKTFFCPFCNTVTLAVAGLVLQISHNIPDIIFTPTFMCVGSIQIVSMGGNLIKLM
jgi:hypothetical protein